MKTVKTTMGRTAFGVLFLMVTALALVLFVGCAAPAAKSDAGSDTDAASSATPTEDTASQADESSSAIAFGKTLIAVFSATGHTESVASMIADAYGGELYTIEAAQPYTEEELASSGYYQDNRPYNESQDPSIRPELSSAPIDDPASYETVFLGYPIWYGKAPTIIYSFLDQNDFSNATIYPFCTSGSSSITESQTVLDEYYPDLNWMPGERFSATATQEEVDAWLKSLA